MRSCNICGADRTKLGNPFTATGLNRHKRHHNRMIEEANDQARSALFGGNGNGTESVRRIAIAADAEPEPEIERGSDSQESRDLHYCPHCGLDLNAIQQAMNV